jgi:hypothetical protein
MIGDVRVLSRLHLAWTLLLSPSSDSMLADDQHVRGSLREAGTAQGLLEPGLDIQKCHSYGSLTSAIHQAYRGRLRSSS